MAHVMHSSEVMGLKYLRPDISTLESRRASLWDFAENHTYLRNTRTQPLPPDYRQQTSLLLRRGTLDIRIMVTGRLPRRARRTLIYLLYGQLKPLFQNLNFTANVWHSDGDHATWIRDMLYRPVSLRQATRTGTEPERFGSFLRLTRNMHGLTQEALAAELKISRVHLSRIEQGRTIMRGATYQRVSQWLLENSGGALEATRAEKSSGNTA